jgi:uncharacterized protein
VPPERVLSQAIARRYLVLHHLLAPPRAVTGGPRGVMAVVDRLGSIQFDPLDICGRNHDLVLLARVAGYRRSWTDGLLYGDDRQLFEAYNKGLSLLPVAELPWHRQTWDRERAAHEGAAFDDHAPLVQELLERIRSNGPLSAADIEPRAAIDWYWRPTNPVRAILEALAEAGILGLRRRDGNRRVYDLIERLLPESLLARREPDLDQRKHRLLSRYRANGLLGRAGSAELWYGTAPGKSRSDGIPTRGELRDALVRDGALIPVTVDGVRGERFVPAGSLPLLDQAEREVAEGRSPGDAAPGVSLLAPLDPLAWDRQLLASLFAFDYVWEVYVPAPKRRWGYYVLPILFGDRLVGRIEPRLERRTGALRIAGLWWERGFEPVSAPGFGTAFADALDALRQFGGVERVTWPTAARHRPLVRVVRSIREAAATATG